MSLEYIKINSKDNNITVVKENGLSEGTCIQDYNLVLKNNVPLGNKIAIVDIKKDEPIIRYGEIIGFADRDISKGELIDYRAIHVNKIKDLDIEVPYLSRKTTKKENKDRCFYGYENPDGTVGTRNLLAIATNVQCSEGFVNKLIDYIEENLLDNYENVDGVVAISHAYG